MSSASHLRTSRDEIQTEVDRFRRNAVVYTRRGEVPKSPHIPVSWLDLLAQQESDGRPKTPAEWAEFGDVLPQVTTFLRKNVCAVGILMEQPDTPSLVYAYRQDGEINLFQGWPPSFVANGPAPRIAAIWSNLPPRVQRLYERVHNGWVFLPSWAMGPARADQIRFLSDDEWNMRPGEKAGLPFRLEDVISIFANGAGDSLCIDTAARQPEKAGLVWWHEEPGKPDIRQDVWAVMDTWFGMFVEGAE